MKRIVTLMAALSLAAAATTAFAGSAVISGTKHNLSTGSTASYKAGAGGTGQICVFCHTPHNAAQNIPLWNRQATASTAAGTFQLYSSVTMKNSKHKTGFTSESISLFCMSCHDGSALGGTAMIKNAPADGTTDMAAGVPGGGPGIAGGRDANLGTDLKNDHPVNFRVLVSDPGIGTVTGNTMKTGSVTNSFPLFASNGNDKYLECGSCHSVHNDTNSPFLRTTNSGSKLCLGCHVK
ncbi:MAG: cytochrome C [Desulfuromonadales bacterium]|nr:MAG: cytochrome C [Desulfuromonadales bacterium]